MRTCFFCGARSVPHWCSNTMDRSLFKARKTFTGAVIIRAPSRNVCLPVGNKGHPHRALYSPTELWNMFSSIRRNVCPQLTNLKTWATPKDVLQSLHKCTNTTSCGKRVHKGEMSTLMRLLFTSVNSKNNCISHTLLHVSFQMSGQLSNGLPDVPSYSGKTNINFLKGQYNKW